MLRDDIDGILVWTATDKEPAIVLERDGAYYWIRVIGVSGKTVVQTQYDTLKQALHAYAELLPNE
jgi:hypothetical protein